MFRARRIIFQAFALPANRRPYLHIFQQCPLTFSRNIGKPAVPVGEKENRKTSIPLKLEMELISTPTSFHLNARTFHFAIERAVLLTTTIIYLHSHFPPYFARRSMKRYTYAGRDMRHKCTQARLELQYG